MTAVWPSQVHILAFVCSHRLLLATQECARWRVLGCGRFFIREEGVGFTGLKKPSPHPFSQLLPWVMSEKKRGMACYSSLLLNDGCWTQNDGWWRVRGLWVGIEQGLPCGKYHDWKKTEFSNVMLVFRQPETEFTVQEADRLCFKSLIINKDLMVNFFLT